MGCLFEIVCWGRPRADMENACGQAFDEVTRLEKQLSVFLPESDIFRINALACEEPVPVDPILFRILQRAILLSDITGGAFDITAGALIRLWGFEGREGRFPDASELEQARRLTGAQHVILAPAEHTVSFHCPGVRINLGGYGKGCAVDAATETLLGCGVANALIDAGTSTVAALGRTPEGTPWRVGVHHPRSASERVAKFDLNDESLSTSGDYEQFFTAGGQRYSHVIDPRTGRPACRAASATVICESAAVSDALSTAALVLGEAGFQPVQEELPGVRSFFVEESG